MPQEPFWLSELSLDPEKIYEILDTYSNVTVLGCFKTVMEEVERYLLQEKMHEHSIHRHRLLFERIDPGENSYRYILVTPEVKIRKDGSLGLFLYAQTYAHKLEDFAKPTRYTGFVPQQQLTAEGT